MSLQDELYRLRELHQKNQEDLRVLERVAIKLYENTEPDCKYEAKAVSPYDRAFTVDSFFVEPESASRLVLSRVTTLGCKDRKEPDRVTWGMSELELDRENYLIGNMTITNSDFWDGLRAAYYNIASVAMKKKAKDMKGKKK